MADIVNRVNADLPQKKKLYQKSWSSRRSQGSVPDHAEVVTKDDLTGLEHAIVRSILEAQGRYSRKRHREHAWEKRTVEEDKIRKWANLLGISLGKQVDDRSGEGGAEWWHKGWQTIIDEIVAIVENNLRSAVAGI